MSNNLKLKPLAIGSLPHTNVESAMNIVEKYYKEIPFVPQLANISKNEDMTIQFLEGMPTFNPEHPEEFVLNLEDEKFISGLEELIIDYEEIIENYDITKLEKYRISENFSHAFKSFENIIQKNNPQYAKAQIIGPFTLLTSLTDNNGNYAIYDDTYKEIIVKLLCLKAIWQIKRIKRANSDTVPIIFIDEPTISQIGTSAFLTINKEEVISMLKEISGVIQNHNGLSAIHCCGKFDWKLLIQTGVNIIDFDAFSFSESISAYYKNIELFLQKGGIIGWGIVPTSDENLLKELNSDILANKYIESVKNLTKKGINEKLVIDNSIITPSCGAGVLNEISAQQAMRLTYEVSEKLRERFKI